MPEFIEATPLDQIPPGSSTNVTVAGKDIALFNVDGTVFATNDACPHAGGSLGFGGKFEGKIVTCSRHGWKFDVTTGAMPSGAGVKLGCYPVQIVDGKVQVAVS